MHVGIAPDMHLWGDTHGGAYLGDDHVDPSVDDVQAP